MFLAQNPLLQISFHNFKKVVPTLKYGAVSLTYPIFYQLHSNNGTSEFSYNYYLSDISTALSLNMLLANIRYSYKLHTFI